METSKWEQAIAEFKSAISLEFEDTHKKRIYGTRFIQYYPHRELGICFYYLGEYDNAHRELELSNAYKNSKRAAEYLYKISGARDQSTSPREIALKQQREQEAREREEQKKIQAETEAEKKLAEEKRKKELKLKQDEKKEQETRDREEQKRLQAELEAEEKAKQLHAEQDKKRKADEEKLAEEKKKKELQAKPDEKKVIGVSSSLPPGALTYDPSKVTQVGSRLSIAIMNFESNEEAKNLVSSVTDKLITQLVNLRRFRVIERSALDKIMQEQKLGMTGFVDEEMAVKVGKLAGADVIILGRINLEPSFAKVMARGIDTETSELIVAKEADSKSTSIQNIERLVEQIAVDFYNDLPLVEGFVMAVESNQIILSIGSSVGVRKGTKCVVYREGQEYFHPTTGEVLGRNVTPLGELVVIQVQERMSIAQPIGNVKTIQIEDKVVVK